LEEGLDWPEKAFTLIQLRIQIFASPNFSNSPDGNLYSPKNENVITQGCRLMQPMMTPSRAAAELVVGEGSQRPSMAEIGVQHFQIEG